MTLPHRVLLTRLPPCEPHVISLKRTELAFARADEVTVTLSPRPRATPLMPTPSDGKRSPPGYGGPSSPRCALPDIPHTRGGCPAAPSDGGRRGSPPGGYPRSRSRSAARAGGLAVKQRLGIGAGERFRCGGFEQFCGANGVFLRHLELDATRCIRIKPIRRYQILVEQDARDVF